MNDDCLFCKIVRGEIPNSTLYEDDEVLVFLDIYPIARGHTLFIPKKHIADMYELNEENTDFMMKLPVIVRKLKEVTGATGINIIQSNGEDAGQVIFHLHFHLIPRYPDDGVIKFPPRIEFDEELANDLMTRFAE
ncbi:MAG: HIT family protein [Candidatus Heimdallarchaeota archaeon]|nr:HIT family protein [Candidatus Heimdallarchaeota archaeon]